MEDGERWRWRCWWRCFDKNYVGMDGDVATGLRMSCACMCFLGCVSVCESRQKHGRGKRRSSLGTL